MEETEEQIKEKLNLKGIIRECVNDILIFSPAVLVFTLFFMGSIGYFINIPAEDFIVNATQNLNTAANITLTGFYNHGYNHPYFYTFLFYFAVFMAFIHPLIYLIINLYKLKKQKKEEENAFLERS